MGTAIIVKCPNCGGYHQAQHYDCEEIVCMGSSTIHNRDRRKFQDMKDNADKELAENPNWNEVRWTTRIDERRDATVLNAPIQKNKGILYTNRENRW